LEEDIDQLHTQIQQLKDDFQKMSKQYNECRSELDEKKNELEKLHLISQQDEMDLNQLSEAIKQIEKEKEVQRHSKT
jgi:flagellar biosynthesis chaperone FliJ